MIKSLFTTVPIKTFISCPPSHSRVVSLFSVYATFMALDKSDLTSKPTKPIQKRANEPSGMWQRRRHPAYVLRSVPWSHWRQGIKKFGVYFREKPSSERWKGSFKTTLETYRKYIKISKKENSTHHLDKSPFWELVVFKGISCHTVITVWEVTEVIEIQENQTKKLALRPGGCAQRSLSRRIILRHFDLYSTDSYWGRNPSTFDQSAFVSRKLNSNNHKNTSPKFPTEIKEENQR